MGRLGEPDFDELSTGCRVHAGRPDIGGQHGPLLEGVQVDVAPGFAAPTRKAELGEAGETSFAVPGEPAGFAPVSGARITPKSFEIGARLGLDWEIDDGAHRYSSVRDQAASSTTP